MDLSSIVELYQNPNGTFNMKVKGPLVVYIGKVGTFKGINSVKKTKNLKFHVKEGDTLDFEEAILRIKKRGICIGICNKIMYGTPDFKEC